MANQERGIEIRYTTLTDDEVLRIYIICAEGVQPPMYVRSPPVRDHRLGYTHKTISLSDILPER
jgi:hypothetical protein